MNAKKERFCGRPRPASDRASRSCAVAALGLLGRVLGLRRLEPLLLEPPRARAAGLGRRLARLRGVRLVDDHRVPPRGQLADLVEHERELLQRRDDDPRLLARERLGELARVLVDPLRRRRARARTGRRCSWSCRSSTSRSVMITTLSKTLRSPASWRRREPVREPGDRVRLARPGRVLDEVALPGAVLARVRLEPAHRVPLVEAREDDLRPGAPLRRRARLRPLDVDEAREQVEPGVALPDLLPEVGGLVAARVERVARAALLGAAG